MKYTVQVRPRAAKQLKALPNGVRRTIVQVIGALTENPRPSGAVPLKGTEFMRVRVRDYRVVYEVRDNVLLVLVVRIGHRRDIYRGL